MINTNKTVPLINNQRCYEGKLQGAVRASQWGPCMGEEAREANSKEMTFEEGQMMGEITWPRWAGLRSSEQKKQWVQMLLNRKKQGTSGKSKVWCGRGACPLYYNSRTGQHARHTTGVSVVCWRRKWMDRWMDDRDMWKKRWWPSFTAQPTTERQGCILPANLQSQISTQPYSHLCHPGTYQVVCNWLMIVSSSPIMSVTGPCLVYQ